MDWVIRAMSLGEHCSQDSAFDAITPIPATNYSLGIDVLAQPCDVPDEEYDGQNPNWATPFYDLPDVPRVPTAEQVGSRLPIAAFRVAVANNKWGKGPITLEQISQKGINSLTQ